MLALLTMVTPEAVMNLASNVVSRKNLPPQIQVIIHDETTGERYADEMRPDSVGQSEPFQPDVKLDSKEVALVKRWKDDDPEAFETIIENYSPPVHAVINKRVRDQSTRDDLTQEVWLKAHKAKDRFNHIAPLQHWLTKIAVNVAISHNRGIKTELYLNLDYLPQPSPNADVQKTVEDRLLVEKIIDTMERIVTTNPRAEKEMTAVRCRYIHEMGYPKIAEILRTSIPHVRVLVSRGLGLIRQSFEQPA